jgi:hypothetical protein
MTPRSSWKRLKNRGEFSLKIVDSRLSILFFGLVDDIIIQHVPVYVQTFF